MMTRSPSFNRIAALAMTGALATSSMALLAPSAAFATPAGGYGDLVESVAPSVVLVEVTGSVDPANAVNEKQMEEFQRRFGQLFPGQPMFPGQPEATPMQGLGSGFLISADGQIVTNSHVVDGAETVTVKLADGRSFQAKVIGSDPLTDIALLKVDADEALPFLDFGSSEQMRPGDEVVAVGNPFGLGGTVTSGIISAKSRNINSGPYDDFIQTDAAINRGNSGGPLFNNEGEVIGVNTAIFSPDGGSVGIGFAVPSDLVQTVVTDLADDGTITRGWLGVQIRPMSDDVASALGYAAPKGAVVELVTPDSPADKAGLQVGDIILSFNGTEISELRDLTRAVASTSPDQDAKVLILHKGKQITKDVTIGTLAQKEA